RGLSRAGELPRNVALWFRSRYVLILSAQVFNCDSGPGLAKGNCSYYVPTSKPERSRIFLPGRWGEFARHVPFLSAADTMAERSSNALRDARQITIRGAREHNLKNVDVAIPRGRLVVLRARTAPQERRRVDRARSAGRIHRPRRFGQILARL